MKKIKNLIPGYECLSYPSELLDRMSNLHKNSGIWGKCIEKYNDKYINSPIQFEEKGICITKKDIIN